MNYRLLLLCSFYIDISPFFNIPAFAIETAGRFHSKEEIYRDFDLEPEDWRPVRLAIDDGRRNSDYMKKIGELVNIQYETSNDISAKIDRNIYYRDFVSSKQIAHFANNTENKFVEDLSISTTNPEENGNYFEGDIKLFKDQAQSIYEGLLHKNDRRKKRKFIGPNPRRWDVRKPIEYSFDGSHSTREQRLIELALQHWHNITCLDFVRRNNKPNGNRIVFTDVDGCASNVGRHPLGEPQYVSLAPECMRLGVIAHEVAHALGFWHEQSRPDRDTFVIVRWENIPRGSKGQFLKEERTEVDNAGLPYDYGSVMHYRSKAFSRFDNVWQMNRPRESVVLFQLFTISTFIKDYQRTIGQRDQLSFNDVRLMNNIYCSASCSTPLPCQRGGYTDPRQCSRCRCPDGFTGRHCQRLMLGYGSECGGKLVLANEEGNRRIHIYVTVDAGYSTISSPNYPSKFSESTECSWLLVAPKGQHVELQFYGPFGMYCKSKHSLCMDYVEVRNFTDFANTGMRYCCYNTPSSRIVSSSKDMLVLFRSFYQEGQGFQARARAIRSTGIWTNWLNWSECSSSCGACGVRERSRTCHLGHRCHGNNVDTELCNANPCEMCPNMKLESTACGGFLGLIGGVRCKVEKTVYEKCDRPCCPGFNLIDNVCQKLL